jgi:hypothetical protein
MNQKLKNLIMRKLLFTFVCAFGMMVTTQAQELGIRFGDVTGGDVAVDAVFSTSEFSRVHANVSFGDGVGIDVLWDFVFRPLGGEDLYWYAGVGPYAFLGDPFALGAVGEIGLEYRFDSIPLVIGADWRPYFRLIDNTDLGFDFFGLNVRYRF